MKRLEIALFIAGVVLFAVLLNQFGVENLVENIQRAGWWIAVVFGLHILVYALNTQTWRLIIGAERRELSWFESFRITVSSFSLNYITPIIMLGGEAYRGYALAQRLDARAAAASVVLFRLIHTLAHLLTWAIAWGMAFFLLPHSSSVMTVLIFTGVALLGAIGLLFLGPRDGMGGNFFDMLQRARFPGALSRFIAAQRQTLVRINDIIVDFYRQRRLALFGGLGLELLARVLAAMEIFFILYSIGVTTTPFRAFYIYSAASLLANIFFFMPFELGIKEGGLYLILPALGLTPAFSVFIGVVGRIREFFWIFVGLLFLLLQGQRRLIFGKLKMPNLTLLAEEKKLTESYETE